jgi:tyrosyl-tRNA synthetase
MERFEVAKRNTVEIITEEELKKLLEQKEEFNFYFGIAPTGPFHLGYLIPLAKLLDLMEVGGKGTILIADYHAYLDDRKTPWEEMQLRAEYIETCVRLVLGNRAEKVRFVRGSEFQLSKEYVEDVIKLTGIVTVKRAIRAASEVVRITESPSVSCLLYPIMQNVDVKYLKADIALGGIDQRHIYALGREILEKVGWKKPICMFTPLITSLRGPGVKMSASKPETHISIHETEKSLKEKIRKAFCPPKEVRNNPIMDIVKLLLFPMFGEVEVKGKKYQSFEELRSDYENGLIHPLDLKESVIPYLEKIITPVREYFEKNKEFFEEVRRSMEKSGYKIVC